MEGTYTPITLKDFSGGWVTRLDRETDSLLPNESPDLENVDFDGQGSFVTRKGYKRIANNITTAGTNLSTYTYRRPIRNDEIIVRHRTDNTTPVLEYYHIGTAQFETIKVTLTGSVAMSMQGWTSAADTVDYLYFDDGVINLMRWTGGHTQLNGALAGGEGTITVDSTAGFPSSGTIVIGTTDVTYAGVTATTFTTCVGTPAAADNLAVTDKPVDFSASAGSKPKGHILFVFKSQLFVATNNYITASDVDDFTDWSGGLYFKKGFKGGKVTAIGSKDDKIVVHTENWVGSVGYKFTGDLTGFQLDIQDLDTATGSGTKFWKSLIVTNTDLFYASADNTIRNLFRATESQGFGTKSICENIKNTLAFYNLSSCAAAVWKNKLYFAVRSDESTINDLILVFDLKYAAKNPSGEAWTKYRIYCADFFVYDNALHFGSSVTQNCYRMFIDANGEFIYTDDGSLIPWHYDIPQLDFDKPELKFRLKKVVSRGFISANEIATYNFAYDYGTNAEQEVSLAGTDPTYVFAPLVAALGEEVVGEGEAGESEDPFDGFPPFTYPFDVGTYDAYNIQVRISGGQLSSRYKQTRLILYVEPQADEMTN